MLQSKIQEYVTDIELEYQSKCKRRLVSSEGIHGLFPGEEGELNAALGLAVSLERNVDISLKEISDQLLQGTGEPASAAWVIETGPRICSHIRVQEHVQSP